MNQHEAVSEWENQLVASSTQNTSLSFVFKENGFKFLLNSFKDLEIKYWRFFIHMASHTVKAGKTNNPFSVKTVNESFKDSGKKLL